MKHHLLFLTFIFFTLLIVPLFSSCEEEKAPTLSRADLAMVDTLYLEEIKLLRPLMDSICKQQFDSLVQIAADSIVQVRLKEIEKQRKRYEGEGE